MSSSGLGRFGTDGPTPQATLPFPQADLRPLDQVMTVLNLTPDGEDVFTGYSLPGPVGRIYGGQVMAQSLIAAGRTLPDDGRLPHSVHVYFLRVGRPEKMVEFRVARLHDGGSFSARQVTALQEGEVILTATASFQKVQEGLDFQVEMPADVPAPETLPSNDELMKHVTHPAAWMLLQTGAFDLRHVERSLYFGRGAERASRQAVWMRARTPLPDATPQCMQRALLAYACDQVMLEPSLRQHGLTWSTPGMVLASLDHGMWFHRDIDVRDWILYVQDSPTTQGGRALGRASLYSRDGALVASVVQEGLLRVPA